MDCLEGQHKKEHQLLHVSSFSFNSSHFVLLSLQTIQRWLAGCQLGKGAAKRANSHQNLNLFKAKKT
jgi:hypothetical protein